jgi:pimeloyl-ACP methyl ester carboxylesterase
MSERIVKINAAEICTESYGNPNDPAVLLIMGATASMIWWEDEFCRLIAGKGRFVIRHDNRDTGRSIVYEPGHPKYDLVDMVDDAAGILDSYGIRQAHIVGMSLGGMIAQMLALRHPDRVLSLIIMMSTVFGPDNPELPQMDEKIIAFHAGAGTIDWSDQQAAIDFTVEKWRILNGSKHPFDEDRILELATVEVNRAVNFTSMFNHAFLDGGDEYVGRGNEIIVPTLIIQGSDDPIFPTAHGVALRDGIPNATLLVLEGTGHELHHGDWKTIVEALAKHTGN